MKQLILLYLLPCFFNVVSFSQAKDNFLIPYNNGNKKWGYANRNGEIVIAPIFDSVSLFYNEKYTEVYDLKDSVEKVGLIDRKGNIVIPIIYNEILYTFQDVKIFVVGKDKYDKNNEYIPFNKGLFKLGVGQITSLKFLDARPFNEANSKFVLEGEHNKNFIIDVKTKKIKPFYGKHFFECGCFNHYNEERMEQLNEEKEYKKYLKTRAPLEPLNKLNVFETNGKKGAYFIYDTTFDFKLKKWHKFKDSIPAVFDGIEEIENLDKELFILKLNNKRGLLNIKTRNYIAPVFDDIIYNPVQKVFNTFLNGKKGLLNKMGDVILPCIQNEVYYPCSSYYDSISYPFIANGKWGLVNNKGEFKGKSEFDTIIFKCGYSNFYNIVIKNGKYGIIDNEANVLQPIIYDQMVISNDNFHFKQGGLYGLKNIKTSMVVIEPKWDTIIHQYPQGYIVKQGGKYGWIDEVDFGGKLFFPITNRNSFSKIEIKDSNNKEVFSIFKIYDNNKVYFIGENGIKFLKE